jgi:hypothetical protein
MYSYRRQLTRKFGLLLEGFHITSYASRELHIAPQMPETLSSSLNF